MSKEIISTTNAPAAVGTYSQAVKIGNTVYLSGQIGLTPDTGVLVTGSDEVETFKKQTTQVFDNLTAVCEAAGGSLADIAKLNIFVVDLAHFALLNEIMASYFSEPYPARAAVQVAALPKGAVVEMDAVLAL